MDRHVLIRQFLFRYLLNAGPSRSSKQMTAQAFQLLSNVDNRLSSQVRSSWRWRILLLRATIDATLASNGGHMEGPVLCAAFDELRAIQFVNKSSACGVPQVSYAC